MTNPSPRTKPKNTYTVRTEKTADGWAARVFKHDDRKPIISFTTGNQNNATAEALRWIQRQKLAAKTDQRKTRNQTTRTTAKRSTFYTSAEWIELRYRALTTYGNRCQCCGQQPPTVTLHVDHIEPRSRRPDLALALSNLQILCSKCNMGKSNVFRDNWRNPLRQLAQITEHADERSLSIIDTSLKP